VKKVCATKSEGKARRMQHKGAFPSSQKKEGTSNLPSGLIKWGKFRMGNEERKRRAKGRLAKILTEKNLRLLYYSQRGKKTKVKKFPPEGVFL